MLELTNHGYMRIIMLNNIYKHYLEIIFKIRKEKGEDNMAKKLFMTIYGRNLVGELKNIVQRPYLVVTMEDLWDRFKDEFDEDCIVHFVKTLEYDEIMAEVERLPKFDMVIGLGGGPGGGLCQDGGVEDPYAALPGADLHRDQRGVRASRGGALRQRGKVRGLRGAGSGLCGLRHHPERPEGPEPQRRVRRALLQQLHVRLEVCGGPGEMRGEVAL